MTPSLMRLVVICAIGIGLNCSSHHTISYGVAGRSPVLAVLSLRDFGATFRTGAMVFLIRWRGGRRAARRRHRSAPAAGTDSAFPELGPGAHALELARTTQTDPLKPPLSLFSLIPPTRWSCRWVQSAALVMVPAPVERPRSSPNRRH